MRKNLLLIVCGMLGLTAWGQTDSLWMRLRETHGLDQARVYNQLARSMVINDPDSSILMAGEALKLSMQYNDAMVRAEALGTMAEGYGYKSEFDSAVMLYMLAIPIVEMQNDRKMLARYYNGLGTMFYQVNDFDKALDYMRRASVIKLEDGELVGYAIITCNIAGVMQRVGRIREAIVLLKDAERKLVGSPYPGIQANVYNTMGIIFQVGFGNLDSAEYYYQKNISLIQQPGLEAFRLAAYRNVGEIYAMTGRLHEAEVNFKKALGLSHLLQRRAERMSIYGSLSDLYARLGDFEKAYDYKRWEKFLYDSLFTEEKEQIIHRLEEQYQGEKKDAMIQQQQLAIQKRRNREIIIGAAGIIGVLILALVAVYLVLRIRAKNQLEQAKTRLFQNIVHEIRTPLTLISAPLQELRKEYQHEGNQENFERMEKNAERLIALVDELLVASRLEKGEYRLSYSMGDVVLFSRHLLDTFAPDAREKQVALSFHPAQPEMMVRFPASAWEKILNNLVSNAIKYNRSGGSVEVRLDRAEETLRLTVTDTGVGIAARHKEKLFQRFYRAHADPTRQGFGIGLSLVAELVRLAGGDIRLESEEGQGTSVHIILPVETDELPKGAPATENSEATRVLVVEDDDGIFGYLNDLLQRSGLQVQRARNGQEGFRLALESLPDLVITDVMMPLEDGISMTRRLKLHELLSHIPVIMLSAKASVQSRLEGMESGADAYLAKPFHPDELTALVNNLLRTLEQQRLRYASVITATSRPYNERMAGGDQYLQKLVEVMDAHILETEFSVNELAEAMHISRSQLHRKITALTGLSTTHFIRNLRLEKARDLLEANAGNVTEIAYQCGFNSPSYFSKTFTEHFGKAPSEFLK